MKLKLKKKSGLVQVPVAAMGDIAFLLIIFFMIAATFAKEKAIDLEAPMAVDLEEVENSAISITVDKEGVVRIEGTECPIDQLNTWTTGVMADRETKLVRLKMDKNLTKTVYGPVFAQLSEAGARIAILGENEE